MDFGFLLAVLAVPCGLAMLFWSADAFVENAAYIAKKAGIPPLLIGMTIVGFGTSAPEIFVSIISSSNGNSSLALGNAYGSNIINISLVIGLTSIINPIFIHSNVLKKELPFLLAISLLSGYLIFDNTLSRIDGTVLLLVFAFIFMLRQYRNWSIE